MLLSTTKHWGLDGIVRRGPSSGNSSDGDSPFSLKRFVKKARRSRTSRTSGDGNPPPPPPPKDGPKRSFSPLSYSADLPDGYKHSTSTEGSNGSRRDIGNGYLKSPHHLNFIFTEVNVGTNSQSRTPRPVSPPLPTLPSKFEPFRRPSGPPAKLPTPAERAKARIEAKREKEMEIRLAIKQEEERQARIKAEKEEQRLREEEEESRRKAKIEQDIRIAQLLKKQREHEQAKADEKFAQEAEERRKVNREKRIQLSYGFQAWRLEQEQSKEKTLREREEEKKRREEEKTKQFRRLFDTMKAECEPSGGLQLSGWISVQVSGTVTWRRRWFVLDEKDLKFFKAQNDTSPVDIIAIPGIRDVRNGGGSSEDEPAFIPNSFAIVDAYGLHWSLFTDTAETMERVMAALISLRTSTMPPTPEVR